METLLFKQHQILTLLNEDVILGLGNTSAWASEANPPSVNTSITQQTELLGYIPVLTKQAVARLSNPTEDTITIKGGHYLPIPSTYEALDTNYCNSILVTGSLDHNSVVGNANSYRSIGLYRDLKFSNGATISDPFIEYLDVVGMLVKLVYFSPQNLVADTTESISLVLSF